MEIHANEALNHIEKVKKKLQKQIETYFQSL